MENLIGGDILYDKFQTLVKELVADSGTSETIEGELLSAVLEIKNQWFDNGVTIIDICPRCYNYRMFDPPYNDTDIKGIVPLDDIGGVARVFSGCGNHPLGSCANYIYKHVPQVGKLLSWMLDLVDRIDFDDKVRYTKYVRYLVERVTEFVLSKRGNYTILDNSKYNESQRHRYPTRRHKLWSSGIWMKYIRKNKIILETMEGIE